MRFAVAKAGTKEWHAARKQLRTASRIAAEAFGYREQGELDVASARRMFWGSADEPTLVRVLAAAIPGTRVRPLPWLWANTRWPGLGASTDAVLLPSRGFFHVARGDVFADPDGADEALFAVERALGGERRPILVELKTTERGGKPPREDQLARWRLQLGLQLSICELAAGLIFARTGVSAGYLFFGGPVDPEPFLKR